MPKKTHLLLISPFFFPANRFQQELAKNLLKLNPDLEIRILCYQVTNRPSQGRFEGLEYYQVPCLTILPDQLLIPNYFSLAKIMGKLRREWGVDAIYTETRLFESSWWIPFLAKLWHVPAFIIDHCAGSPVHRSKIVMFLGKILDRTWIKFCLNRYQAVLVSNLAVESYLQKLGVKNLRVISTGVDYQFFHLPKVRSNKAIMITFLSRLVSSKGVGIFYQSAKEIVTKDKNVTATIAGYGELYKSLEKQIKDDGLTEKVFLKKDLTREEVRDLLSVTDIFVHPSYHNEGIPNIILEAGAAGCAVVASNAGGTGEVITSETGILLKTVTEPSLKRGIQELIDDKGKRLRLANNLQATVEKEFRWSKVAERFGVILG